MWNRQHIISIWRRRYQICISVPFSCFCFILDFYFCTKLCILTMSRVLTSSMTIAFWTYSPKCPNKTFLVPNLFFFLFWIIFCISANSRMLISNITIVFNKYWPKYPNKPFLVPFFVAGVVLLDFWYLDKLEGADGKYDISFFKFQSENTQKGPFLSKFKNFYFCTKLYILINSRVLISNMGIIFQTYSPKLHK